MAYTVKNLSKLSGVSVRTLHFYDEIGLLRPAFVGENGYRYYEDTQLLKLQQILFFRELAFPLAEIQKLLERDDFDRVEALRSHRQALEKNLQQTRRLIDTIDKTIARLKGETTMKDKEMFEGFDKRKQAAYEEELVKTYGEEARNHIAESKRRTKNWTKEDWERNGKEFTDLLPKLVTHLERNDDAALPEVQELIRLHHRWLLKFWTPNRESYAGLGRLYADHPDFRKNFDPLHPKLADYLASAMEVFSRTL